MSEKENIENQEEQADTENLSEDISIDNDQENIDQPEVPKIITPETPKSKSFLNSPVHIILLLVSIGILMSFVYIAYSTIKRKMMGIEERITEVEYFEKINTKKYLSLKNASQDEYMEKIVDYLEFLVNKAPVVREDLKNIFNSKNDYKVKSINLLLNGGRSKKQAAKSRKRGQFSIAEYKKYLEEARLLIAQGNRYKKPIHTKLSKKFKPSKVSKNLKKDFDEAEKKYKLLKTKVKEYKGRLKIKISQFKALRKERAIWMKQRSKKKRDVAQGTTKKQDEKKTKELIIKDGLTDDQILQAYKTELNKLKLEIIELRKTKQTTYKQYKKAKGTYSRLKKDYDSSKSSN